MRFYTKKIITVTLIFNFYIDSTSLNINVFTMNKKKKCNTILKTLVFVCLFFHIGLKNVFFVHFIQLSLNVLLNFISFKISFFWYRYLLMKVMTRPVLDDFRIFKSYQPKGWFVILITLKFTGSLDYRKILGFLDKSPVLNTFNLHVCHWLS